MMNFLTKLCIPAGTDPKSHTGRVRCGTMCGIVGIILNCLLSAAKLSAGLLCGSIAMVADAVNNLTDAASSIVTLIGFRLSARKADREHPFGHGRIEYLCGMAVSLLIILSGAELAQQSVIRIMNPAGTIFSTAACTVAACSILVKYFMMRFYNHFAVLTDSSALQSAAVDSRCDCIATLAVLSSMLVHQLTGLNPDGICGLAVAVFIIVSGLMSLSKTVTPLLGAEPDPAQAAQIEALVTGTDGVLGMHDLVIHDYGCGHGMITLHAEMDAADSLTEAHALADHLERTIEERFGLQTVIHIDPADLTNPLIRTLRTDLTRFLTALDPGIRFHDLQAVSEADGSVHVSFDLALPFGCALSDETVLRAVSAHLTCIDASIRPLIRIDHYDPELISSAVS